MLELKIVSLNGGIDPVKCDSVNLILCDDDMGNRGGSIGIREGHIKSLLSVDRGKVSAYLNGEEIFFCQTAGGFATVENDIVTVVTEKIMKE